MYCFKFIQAILYASICVFMTRHESKCYSLALCEVHRQFYHQAFNIFQTVHCELNGTVKCTNFGHSTNWQSKKKILKTRNILENPLIYTYMFICQILSFFRWLFVEILLQHYLIVVQ